MVKPYYIQDYPENFRGKTEIRNNSLGFHQAVNREQSNQAREKNAHHTRGVSGEGRSKVAFYKLLI